jgi:hypothetical protein
MSQVNPLYPHFLLQMYKRVKNPTLDLLQKMHLFYICSNTKGYNKIKDIDLIICSLTVKYCTCVTYVYTDALLTADYCRYPWKRPGCRSLLHQAVLHWTSGLGKCETTLDPRLRQVWDFSRTSGLGKDKTTLDLRLSKYETTLDLRPGQWWGYFRTQAYARSRILWISGLGL